MKSTSWALHLALSAFLVAVVPKTAFANQPEAPKERPPRPISSMESMKKIVPPINRFGIALLKKVTKSADSKNVMISPFGIEMALGMVHNGAAGKTLQSMRKAMYSDFSTTGVWL